MWAWYLCLYCLSACFQRMCCHSAVTETQRTKLQSHMRLQLPQSTVSACCCTEFPICGYALSQCCFVAQMAGHVATQLWEEWQCDDVQADVFNVNVPLGFKTVDGTPVKPEVLHTTVDMQSQYSSLYSKLVGYIHPGSVLNCFPACIIPLWMSQLHQICVCQPESDMAVQQHEHNLNSMLHLTAIQAIMHACTRHTMQFI